VTVKAIATGYVMKTADSIADRPLRYAATDIDDGARKFVAQNLGGPNQPMLNLFYIRSADATGGDPDENFPLGNFRHRYVFGDHLPGAAINACFHAPLFSIPLANKSVPALRHSRYLSRNSASFRAALELSIPNRIN